MDDEGRFSSAYVVSSRFFTEAGSLNPPSGSQNPKHKSSVVSSQRQIMTLATLCTSLLRSLQNKNKKIKKNLDQSYSTKLAHLAGNDLSKNILTRCAELHVEAPPLLVKQLPSSVQDSNFSVTLKDVAHVSTNKTKTLMWLQPDVHKSHLPPALHSDHANIGYINPAHTCLCIVSALVYCSTSMRLLYICHDRLRWISK